MEPSSVVRCCGNVITVSMETNMSTISFLVNYYFEDARSIVGDGRRQSLVRDGSKPDGGTDGLPENAEV